MNDRPTRAYNRRTPLESTMSAVEPEEAVALMDEGVHRPEMRAEPRPAMREESSRDRAARRAAEIMGHLPDENEGADAFNASSLQPDGFTYEWKMHTVLGESFPQRQLEQAKHGWEAVPASRHPELMPHGWKGESIEREGLVLMERPAEITDEMKRRDRRAALEPIEGMREKLSGTPQGQFARVDGNGKPTAKVAKAYSPVDIPGDAG